MHPRTSKGKVYRYLKYRFSHTSLVRGGSKLSTVNTEVPSTLTFLIFLFTTRNLTVYFTSSSILTKTLYSPLVSDTTVTSWVEGTRERGFDTCMHRKEYYRCSLSEDRV